MWASQPSSKPKFFLKNIRSIGRQIRVHSLSGASTCLGSVETREFSLLRNPQTSPGAHKACCSVCTGVAQSVYRIATGWTVLGSNPGEDEIFRIRPDRPWCPPSLLYNGYRASFPVVKRPGRGADHPPYLVPRLKNQ